MFTFAEKAVAPVATRRFKVISSARKWLRRAGFHVPAANVLFAIAAASR
jgi:hypothetical protein